MVPVLQTILFGTFVPQEGGTVRKHRFGIADGSGRYVAPKPRNNSTRDESGLTQAERVVYAAMLKCDGYVSAADVSIRVKMTRNYCQIILASLCKAELLCRYKLQRNGTRLYMYKAKGSDDARRRSSSPRQNKDRPRLAVRLP